MNEKKKETTSLFVVAETPLSYRHIRKIQPLKGFFYFDHLSLSPAKRNSAVNKSLSTTQGVFPQVNQG